MAAELLPGLEDMPVSLASSKIVAGLSGGRAALLVAALRPRACRGRAWQSPAHCNDIRDASELFRQLQLVPAPTQPPPPAAAAAAACRPAPGPPPVPSLPLTHPSPFQDEVLSHIFLLLSPRELAQVEQASRRCRDVGARAGRAECRCCSRRAFPGAQPTYGPLCSVGTSPHEYPPCLWLQWCGRSCGGGTQWRPIPPSPPPPPTSTPRPCPGPASRQPPAGASSLFRPRLQPRQRSPQHRPPGGRRFSRSYRRGWRARRRGPRSSREPWRPAPQTTRRRGGVGQCIWLFGCFLFVPAAAAAAAAAGSHGKSRLCPLLRPALLPLPPPQQEGIGNVLRPATRSRDLTCYWSSRGSEVRGPWEGRWGQGG